MRLARVLLGAALGAFVLLILWITGTVDPPEAIARRLAAIAAVYPGPVGRAEVERIPCAPLRRLRLYVVCTAGCGEVWRLVAVRGLRAENLQNLNRIPAEPPEEARARVNEAIRRERLRPDVDAARELIGCYMLLDGMHPELVLLPADREAVERARGNESALAALADSLDEAAALSRIEVQKTVEGFASRFLYWDTTASGRPVLELDWRLGPDGSILFFEAHPAPIKDDTAVDSIRGSPPT